MFRPLPKSLHTVTVLARIAQSANLPNEEAIEFALTTLGYDPKNDPYGLAAQALRQLQ